MERSFKLIGAAAVSGLAAAAAAASALAIRSIDTADKMGEAAQAAGTTVERFSALTYAGKLAGVSQEQLSSSLIFLSKNLQKANQATQEGRAAQSALATLFKGNIPVFRDSGEAFQEISKRLDELPDGLQKTALAAQTLGTKTGAALIPMTKGLDEAIQRAQKLGIVITGDTARSADKFNDTIEDMHAAINGLGISLASALLPHLQKLATALLENIEKLTSSKDNMLALKQSVQVLASGIVILGGSLYMVGQAAGVAISSIDAFWRVLKEIPGTKAAREAVEFGLAEIKASTEQFTAAWKGFKETYNAIWDDTKTNAEDATNAIKNSGTVLQEAVDPKKAEALVSSLRENVELMGKTAGEAAAYRVELEGGSKALQQQAFHWATLAEAIKAATSAMPKPTAPINIPGLLEAGNINLNNRPKIPVPGTDATATVRSMSFEQNGQEILVPTAVNDRILSSAEAIRRYEQTGEHLGKFASAAFADAYAEQLHNDYEAGKFDVPINSAAITTNLSKITAPIDTASIEIAASLKRMVPPEITQTLPDAFGQLTVKIQGLDDELQKQADALNRENRPAIEKYNEEMAKLQLLQDKFGLSAGAAAIEAAKIKEQLLQTSPIAVATRQALDEMFTQAIFRAKGFKDALGNVLERMAELIFQVKVLDPLLNKLFSINPATGASTGGGGILGSIFGAIGGLFGGSSAIGVVGAGTGVGGFGIPLIAGFASGGQVSGGVPIMVGEKGPEYFVPNTSGRIIPNGGMGTKATFVFNVDARGADAGIEQRVYKVLRETAPVIVDNAVAKMIDLQRRTA